MLALKKPLFCWVAVDPEGLRWVWEVQRRNVVRNPGYWQAWAQINGLGVASMKALEAADEDEPSRDDVEWETGQGWIPDKYQN